MHTAFNTVIEQLTISRLPDIRLTHMPFVKRVTLRAGSHEIRSENSSFFISFFDSLLCVEYILQTV